MSITGKQIAMARILLDLSQEDLAEKIGIARKTINRIENGQSPGSTATMNKIKTYFENNGIEFTHGEGTRKYTGQVKVLKGNDGFSAFLDDVYSSAKEHGSRTKPFPIYVSNARHSNWIKWMGEDRWKAHVKRMINIRDQFDIRIITKEGDTYFPASDYSSYKWFPESLWNEQSFYSYGPKLAFLNFLKDEVKVMILEQKEFAEGYRVLFNIAWNRVAIDPPKT